MNIVTFAPSYLTVDLHTIDHDLVRAFEGDTDQRQAAISLCLREGHTLAIQHLKQLADHPYNAFEIIHRLGYRVLIVDSPELQKIIDDMRNGIPTDKDVFKRIVWEKHYGHLDLKALAATGRKSQMQNARHRAAPVIPVIENLRHQGQSFGKIADKLNEKGFTTSRDSTFTPMAVKRIHDRYIQA